MLLSFACPLKGQNPRGSLQGEVQDAMGARIATATVSVSNNGIAVERTTQVNGQGEFRIDDLPSGRYEVVVYAGGFAAATSETTVVVSSVRDILVTLHPATVQQGVEVHADGSSITTQPFDPTRTVQQGTVTAQDLHDMPLAARSFANIAYMAPGTAPVEPSDRTKARITAVSFGGSSVPERAIVRYGGDNTDDYIGGFLQNFSPDAIQEFAVQTSQQYADTGRTVRGSAVIATRHGTDQWHGTAASYERAAALNARNDLDNSLPQPKQPFSRQNYVETIGGLLKRGRVWLFSSFEYVDEDAINYSPDTLDQFHALSALAAQGLIPGSRPSQFLSTCGCPLTTSWEPPALTGRNRRARSGSCAERWTATSPTIASCNRLPCPPPAPPCTQTTSTWY